MDNSAFLASSVFYGPHERPRDGIISIGRARELTGLDLVPASEAHRFDGLSYHALEQSSESRSHASAREEARGYFVSIGYEVFPEGVGVRDTYAMADLLAVRDGRIVFVEVLSDSNVKMETIERKRLLQAYGELCFVFFSGTKRSDVRELRLVKEAVCAWADVLYCRLHGYNGNRIESEYQVSVAYDTTKGNGIRIAVAREGTKAKPVISLRFLTHRYTNPMNTPISYPVLDLEREYEEVFLAMFGKLAREMRGRIAYTSSLRRRYETSHNAMQRKSGLAMKMDEKVICRLRSGYRGTPLPPSLDGWPDWRAEQRARAGHLHGVFAFEKAVASRAELVVDVAAECGLTPILFDGSTDGP